MSKRMKDVFETYEDFDFKVGQMSDEQIRELKSFINKLTENSPIKVQKIENFYQPGFSTFINKEKNTVVLPTGLPPFKGDVKIEDIEKEINKELEKPNEEDS